MEKFLPCMDFLRYAWCACFFRVVIFFCQLLPEWIFFRKFLFGSPPPFLSNGPSLVMMQGPGVHYFL